MRTVGFRLHHSRNQALTAHNNYNNQFVWKLTAAIRFNTTVCPLWNADISHPFPSSPLARSEWDPAIPQHPEIQVEERESQQSQEVFTNSSVYLPSCLDGRGELGGQSPTEAATESFSTTPSALGWKQVNHKDKRVCVCVTHRKTNNKGMGVG